jgi:hypothetical protein
METRLAGLTAFYSASAWKALAAAANAQCSYSPPTRPAEMSTKITHISSKSRRAGGDTDLRVRPSSGRPTAALLVRNSRGSGSRSTRPAGASGVGPTDP